ncbi:permease prefix domain 1-containing protein [Clostridium aciditolerans]|uniref:Uncharacterized protein n=1 Tax=Clostridium aciditolerans TaxID=339861 RepID=A0A934I267_9CLOT|nr:permease prefix domain 1-containing protein [Clostridium aciditolerans]MBI6875467.1 hypothetical protein [Clostridium aciditolerans]
MNKIEDYIYKIYENFDNADEDTKILKEEMRTHLYEEVEELKKQGLSEEESIDKALENFGKDNSVVNEMNYILRNRSIFTKMLIKAGVVVFIIGCLFQVISIFYSGEGIQYFSGDLIKNGFRSISYLLFMISLAIWDIAFYYYYYLKNNDLVVMAFLLCDFVICIPVLFIWVYFPNHKMASMTFILGITFVITLILRIYYVKNKKWN